MDKIALSEMKGAKVPMWKHRMGIVATVVFVLSVAVVKGQQPPREMDKQPPNPAPNRIEVRFALGKKTVSCKKFYLSAKIDGHEIMSGSFSSGFQIPQQLANLPQRDALELELKCSGHRWHFTEAGERAFLQGYWWVGTDYPPFQESFQLPVFRDSAWIDYLIVKPTKESGFIVYKHCPKALKDKKPGPCYE
jgi:hypothetical protein